MLKRPLQEWKVAEARDGNCEIEQWVGITTLTVTLDRNEQLVLEVQGQIHYKR